MLTKKIIIKECDFFACTGRFCDIVKLDPPGENSIAVLPFNAFGEIDLSCEISGESAFLAAVCAYSAYSSSTVFCGVKTRLMGLKHISVAVAHKGRLIDIVDRTQNSYDEEYVGGNKIKIFSSNKIKVAALVDSDVLNKSIWQKTAPHCDAFVCILNEFSQDILPIAFSYSDEYGAPIIIVSEDGIFWKD